MSASSLTHPPSSISSWAGLHAPAHLDAEVLSGLGRIHRAGDLSAVEVTQHLDTVAVAPITRHDLPGLLAGAWGHRSRIRLADALTSSSPNSSAPR